MVSFWWWDELKIFQRKLECMERYLEKASRPEDLAVAIRAAQKAGEVMDKYQEKIDDLDVEEKSHHNDVVTEADLEAQEKIVEIISDEFPEDGFKGEEDLETESLSRRNWVVDPIDGTSNFERGLPYFCTSIGLKVDGKYVLGVVYSPESALDKMFFACHDSGAYRVSNGEIEKLEVSEKESLKSAVILSGINERDRSEREKDIELTRTFMDRGAKFRKMGSAALNICMTASGSAEAVMFRYLYEWDYAAGKIILEESGGKLETWETEGDDCSFMATNSGIHEELDEIFSNFR